MRVLHLLLLVGLHLNQGCSARPPVKVVAAPALPVTAPALPEHRSRLEAELTIDVTAPLEAARAAVPQVIRTSDNWGTPWDGGNGDQGWLFVDEHGAATAPDRAPFKVRGEVVRDRIDYALAPGAITYVGYFRYRLHGQGRFGFWVGGTCPGGNTPTLNLVVTGQTTLSVSRDWQLAPQTRLTVASLDKCDISVGPFHAPPELMDALRAAIERVVLTPIAAQIDRQIAAIDLRAGVASLWQKLQQPIAAAPGFAIALHPRGISLGTLIGSGTSAGNSPRAIIVTTVGVEARPTVAAAVQPAESAPLPEMQDPAGGGVFVEAAIEFPYETLSRGLATLIGKPLIVGDAGANTPEGAAIVRSAAARPAGSGQLAIDVAFEVTGEHPMSGTATLVGKPVIDAMNQSVTFPSLDFTTATDSLLLDAYIWLKKSALRERLRAAVRLDWRDRLPVLESSLISSAASQNIDLTVDHRDVAGVRFDDVVRVEVAFSGAMKVAPIIVR